MSRFTEARARFENILSGKWFLDRDARYETNDKQERVDVTDGLDDDQIEFDMSTILARVDALTEALGSVDLECSEAIGQDSQLWEWIACDQPSRLYDQIFDMGAKARAALEASE